MSELTDKLDRLVYFTLEHGNTLKNHKQFGEMYQELRNRIRDREFRISQLDTALNDLITTQKEINQHRADYEDGRTEGMKARLDNAEFTNNPFIETNQSKAQGWSRGWEEMDQLKRLDAINGVMTQVKETLEYYADENNQNNYGAYIIHPFPGNPAYKYDDGEKARKTLALITPVMPSDTTDDTMRID